ncbi:hypothetical protein FHR24_000396 [Wenyingzhuangia heitensis]|uniref:Uncharacterized protein n=1 Tax=Wenyingzhuangia heitensis TaxID=1487859 RepID=A0ABX0U517_9FLAO|nr:hypothetical protein [Wenyingzhuangia heitensis]NIJ43957.1 hypothetical protein [Wenyingzhuangia heitensis]
MGEEVSWRVKNNNKFLKVDFSNVKSDVAAVLVAKNAFNSCIPCENKTVRALVVVNGGQITPMAMREIMEMGKNVQDKLKKSAIVGVVGMLSLLFRIYMSYTGSKLRFFTDESAALEYILSDN